MAHARHLGWVALLVGSLLIAGCGGPPPTVGHPKGGPESIAHPGRPLTGLQSIYMINANNGWGLTETSILRTTNGGMTWADVTPGWARNWNIQDAGVFQNAQDAWVPLARNQGDTIAIARTTNGGKTWTSAPIAGELPYSVVTDMDFISENQGWILEDFGAAAGSDAVAVYRTTDGGNSWVKQLAIDIRQGVFESHGLPFGGDKTGLAFSDPEHGWVTGHSNGNGVWLYRTGDGGASWRGQTIPLPAGHDADNGAASTLPQVFFSRLDGILPVQLGYDTFFYRTSDGGTTWQPSAPLPDLVRFGIPGPWGLSVTSSGHLFALGSKNMYFSADRGKSWSPISSGIPAQKLYQIDFISDQTGWAIGQSAAGAGTELLKTGDGGRTWVAVGPTVHPARG